MTPERLREIEARLARATPGPWFWSEDGIRLEGNPTTDTTPELQHTGEVFTDDVLELSSPEDDISDGDADLIAHAPTDLRDLLDAHASQAEELERMRADAEERESGGWLIFYEDNDMAPEVFCGAGAEQAAKARYEIARQHWSCILFRQCSPEHP